MLKVVAALPAMASLVRLVDIMTIPTWGSPAADAADAADAAASPASGSSRPASPTAPSSPAASADEDTKGDDGDGAAVRASASSPPVADDPLAAERRPDVRFPFDASVNAKMALWDGDLCRVEADAVMCAVNENYTDRVGLAGRLFEVAGPELVEECQYNDPCKTGEVVMVKGCRLPARRILFTVGPRYNEKYKNAAENALHNCYRNGLRIMVENKLNTVVLSCVYSAVKGYPRRDAAHITIRTVRRFLEHCTEHFERVAMAMESSEDLAIYRELLPLYFPRDDAEAEAAEKLLPAYTGNEWGETVIEERKIRVREGGGAKAGEPRRGSRRERESPLPPALPWYNACCWRAGKRGSGNE